MSKMRIILNSGLEFKIDRDTLDKIEMPLNHNNMIIDCNGTISYLKKRGNV